ncbi:hypothetical protein CDAR_213191 [Caerostris darwini]|uniref:Uncharacterized protein n=1 Tax=Caerostris darwini TaxID=1538125 RepID=A0AAV4PVW2_9ARAC|nr:hypothetical protein CDAR_213191 [Caerostris darwini]
MLQLFSSDTLFGRHRSPGAIGSLWGGVESSSGHVPTVGASVAEACEKAREKCVLPISRKEFPLDSTLPLFSHKPFLSHASNSKNNRFINKMAFVLFLGNWFILFLGFLLLCHEKMPGENVFFN